MNPLPVPPPQRKAAIKREFLPKRVFDSSPTFQHLLPGVGSRAGFQEGLFPLKPDPLCAHYSDSLSSAPTHGSRKPPLSFLQHGCPVLTRISSTNTQTCLVSHLKGKQNKTKTPLDSTSSAGWPPASLFAPLCSKVRESPPELLFSITSPW